MGRILVLGEPGNAIIPELAPVTGELVLTKPGKGAFCRTDFENMLRVQAITHLLVGGVTTEVCVQTTLREANDRGFECLLIEDATASYFPEFKQATLEMVRAQGGIVASTASSTDVLLALGETDPPSQTLPFPVPAAESPRLPATAVLRAQTRGEFFQGLRFPRPPFFAAP